MSRIEWENFSAAIAAFFLCMIERRSMPEFQFRDQNHRRAEGMMIKGLMHGPPAVDQNGLTGNEIAFIRGEENNCSKKIIGLLKSS
jgi:hypothetical protein